MQFVITAYDGKDMLERRMAVRTRHLQNMGETGGKVICAGGILDDEGKPKGSVLVLDFASRELLDDYLEREPYIQEGFWERVEVEPMNVVIINDAMIGK